MLFGCIVSVCASAQTPSNPPLNLNSDEVVKEISKEPQPADISPAALSSAQSNFEQSILYSESHRKITGMVEAGAAIGSLPDQRSGKADNFHCEHAAVAINDEISKNAQIGIYAEKNTCNAK